MGGREGYLWQSKYQFGVLACRTLLLQSGNIETQESSSDTTNDICHKCLALSCEAIEVLLCDTLIIGSICNWCYLLQSNFVSQFI